MDDSSYFCATFNQSHIWTERNDLTDFVCFNQEILMVSTSANGPSTQFIKFDVL